MMKHYEKYGFGLWAVIHKESNDLLGQCELTIQELNGEKYLEIGYLLELIKPPAMLARLEKATPCFV